MRRRTTPRSTYRLGEHLERQTVSLLKRMGYVHVMRSAGSRGAVDVLGLASDGSVLLVTCKSTGGLQKKERVVLGRLARRLPKSVSIWVSRWGLTHQTPILESLARGRKRRRTR